MTPALLRAMAGLVGWGVAFSLLYALQGAVCSPEIGGALRLSTVTARALLIAAWLIATAGLACLSWRFWPPQRSAPLLEWLAPVLALTGLVSIIMTGLPVLATTICALT